MGAFGPPVAWAAVRSWAVVLLLLTFCLLLLPLRESVLFYVLLYVTLCPFSYCNHLDGEERAGLSSWCLVMVERLYLAVPWGCLRFVIVVFPDHTHLLFFGMGVKLIEIAT